MGIFDKFRKRDNLTATDSSQQRIPSLLEEKAKKLLDICIKYRPDLFYFLIDGPGFDLYTKDGYGGQEYAVNVRIQAIYDKYKEYPEVKDLFEKTLLDVAENNKYGKYVSYLLLLLEYQLRQEKNQTAPFEINASLILDKLRKNIMTNYDIFNRPWGEEYPNGFISIFKQHNSLLQEIYGYRIL